LPQEGFDHDAFPHFWGFLFATVSAVMADSSLRAQGQPGNATNYAAADSSAQALAHIIKKINVVGAGNSKGQGTTPFGIVADNTVVGSYIDSSNATHGFMWNPTTFHITKINPSGSVNTYLGGMNSTHAITGFYPDSGGVARAFLRSPAGHYTLFNAPGAGTGSGQGTIASDINTSGEIVGDYNDSNGVYHVFFRTPAGKFLPKFDAPGAGTGSGQGTFVSGFSGLTDKGAIAGNYTDSSGISHGYLRLGNGTFTGPIDPTGSVNTYAIGLSLSNTFAGLYFDSSGVFHAFLFAGGTYTPVNAPNSVETTANNIDPAGTLEGFYFDSSFVEHGYVRTSAGHFTEFSVSGGGTGGGQGTSANSSNSNGWITGNIVDSNGVNHGFVRE
jgi:hypothetical protein